MFFDPRTCVYVCFLWVFCIPIFPSFGRYPRCQSCLPLRWPAHSARMLMLKIFVFVNGVGTPGGLFLSQILLVAFKFHLAVLCYLYLLDLQLVFVASHSEINSVNSNSCNNETDLENNDNSDFSSWKTISIFL